jgi:hypothetical protein
MNATSPTESQIQQFLKACEETDYNMVDYFMYYYEVPFMEGYIIGNRKIKKLIKMDSRRRTFVNMMLGHEPRIHVAEFEDGHVTVEHHIDEPYSKTKNMFMALCQCEMFGRKAKLNNYLSIKAMIIFLVETGDHKSASAMRRFPYDLIRMTAGFL